MRLMAADQRGESYQAGTGICRKASTTRSPNAGVLIMITPEPGLDKSAVE
jgi:hypothetical protein